MTSYIVAHIFEVIALMAAGVYATAVLDIILGRALTGCAPRIGESLARPVQGTALLLLQHGTTTEHPDAAGWAFAPALLGASSITALSLVPFASSGATWEVASGIVYFGAAMALVMVAVYLEGWSANSVFSLIGGYRFVAQALSYEMPLALVLIAAALPSESLAIGDIVRSQTHVWNVARQPLGLPLYLIASVGLAFWGPLGLPEAKDLAGGTSAELSGIALLLWRGAHLSVVVVTAAMGAAVFLGGWLGPWLPGTVWVVLKTFALIVIILASGHTLARVRLQWFVRVAWTILIPAALIDVFASGVLVLWAKTH